MHAGRALTLRATGGREPRMPLSRCAVLLALALGLAGCGTAATVQNRPVSALINGRAHAVQPTAGAQGPTANSQVQNVSPGPVWDPNAHAPPLSQVRRELRLEYVTARVTGGTYIDPLRYVRVWERTDQGVDAVLPVGAPILAPCTVKIL